MKILIIGNPIASGGNAERKIRRLKTLLEKQGHMTESYLTKFSGDGKQMVSKRIKNIDRIVVVGGDGTVNEIINGMPAGVSPPILQLPMGNANILAMDLKLPVTVSGTADLIESGKVIYSDLAQMNGCRFMMIAGVGFDARVTERVKKKRTGKISNLIYLEPILQAWKNHSQSEFRVVVDEKIETKGAMVLVCNVRNYGGICEVACDADVESGVLDVVVFPADDMISFMKYFLFARFSTVKKIKGVSYLKGKKILITSDKMIPVELDGDFRGRYQQVDIEMLPHKIPLVVPFDHGFLQ